jgi:hypothetical protein
LEENNCKIYFLFLLISFSRADEKTIKDYNIEAGNTVLMVLQLRGGF